jgi:hypothetical protein
MKRFLFTCLLFPMLASSQQLLDTGIERINTTELMAESALSIQEDDEPDKRPGQVNTLAINQASAEALRALHLLTELQIQSLIAYRYAFGAFIHLHELQAVPLFDKTTILSLLPLIRLEDDGFLNQKFFDGMFVKEWKYTLRLARNWRSAANANSGINWLKPDYLGAPYRVMKIVDFKTGNGTRMRWQMEQDMGEPFLWHTQQKGFDFLSGFIRTTPAKMMPVCILGDYQVNFGQGLIQWHSFALQKGMEPTASFRQSESLRPHTSSMESGFFRGVGMMAELGRFKVVGFFSRVRQSATLAADTGWADGSVQRIRTDGYHRTVTEQAGRHQCLVQTIGQSIQWRKSNHQLNVQWVATQFGMPLQTPTAWYQRHQIVGKKWMNASFDFHGSTKQWFYYGELGVDAQHQLAALAGLWYSILRGSSLHLHLRYFPASFRAVNAQVFGESGLPWNEKGLFFAFQTKQQASWWWRFNYDLYAVPWMRYRMNRSSSGQSLMMAGTWTLNKRQQFEFQIRKRWGLQPGVDHQQVTRDYLLQKVTLFRFQYRMQPAIAKSYSFRFDLNQGRVESIESVGFQCFADHTRHHFWHKMDIGMRLYYVQQPHYNLRFYTFERGGFPGGLLTSLYGNGWRTSIQLSRQWAFINKKRIHNKLNINTVGFFSYHHLQLFPSIIADEDEGSKRRMEAQFQLTAQFLRGK